MLLIEKTSDLKDFCNDLEKEEFITVDLEFMREKTYYAQICLIQVASKNTAAIIDPIAKDIDLSPFWEIMQNEKIVKVFHSCRQDIEIIHNMSGKIPHPLFDTQIAAMVCGFGDSVSYENLVNDLLGKKLDKTCRLTNWHLRPLDEKQLEYALSDVTHLVNVYEKLLEIMKQKNREHWIDDEIAELQDVSLYEQDPDEVWRKIRYSSHSTKFLRILQRLAKWREFRAQRYNLPRQMIIKDECLVSIAAAAPKNTEQLSQVRNIRVDILKGKLASEIIEEIKEALTHPIKIKKEKKQKMMNSEAASFYELLKIMLKIVSLQEGVASKVIASDENLKNFSMAYQDNVNPMLKGWRKEIFGKDAMLLREGKISICYDCKSHRICFNHE